MTPAWACLAVGCFAASITLAAIDGYRTLRGAPSCVRECHAVIPPAEWSPGGVFARGGALYGMDQPGWVTARGVQSDNQAARSFAPPVEMPEPAAWSLLMLPVVGVLWGRA